MPKNSVELREERATLVHEIRKDWEGAEAREGGATAEDEAKFDSGMVEAEKLLKRAERLEKLEVSEAGLESVQERTSLPNPSAGERDRDEQRGHRDAERVAFRSWLRDGEAPPALQAVQKRAQGREFRDTVISTSSKGGYLITPVQISEDIVAIVEDLCFIRSLCKAAGSITTVTSAQKLGIRKKTAHMAAANWTTEVAAVTEDTTMAFDRRDLEPQLLSKLALVSLRTLMLSSDAEKEVTGELGYMFGITEENAFLNGTGAGQPLGVFTASASGISTGRDVVAAAATSFTADNLIDTKYSLKQAYQNDKSTAWVASREFVKRARKLKVASTTGGNDLEYVWQPGLTEGAPDKILDIPYCMSEYAPNTFTTGLYVAVLGCFRLYRIAQLVDVAIQRLVEKYADTNQIGFIGRRWVDGAPILEEGFARLKLA